MAIWIMVNDVDKLPDSVAMFAPLLAKSVSFWNPLVYVARNTQFRLAMKRIVCRRFFKDRGSVHPVAEEPKQGQSVSTDERSRMSKATF